MNIRMIGFLFLFIFSLTIASPYFMLAAQTTQGMTEIKTYIANDKQKMNLTKNVLISATSFSENSDFTPTKGAKLVWTPFLVWAAKLLAGWLFTKLANYGTYQFCRHYNDYNWASDKVCDVGSPAHRD